MDVANRQEVKPCRTVANATQLYQATGRTGSPGRTTWGFLDGSPALSKGINVSRTAALSLGVTLGVRV